MKGGKQKKLCEYLQAFSHLWDTISPSHRLTVPTRTLHNGFSPGGLIIPAANLLFVPCFYTLGHDVTLAPSYLWLSQTLNFLTFIERLRIFKKINCSLWTAWGFCALCILSESWWNVNQTCPCDIWLHEVFELLVLLCVTVKMKSFQSIMRAAVNAVALRDPRSSSDADMYSLLHACTHTDTH